MRPKGSLSAAMSKNTFGKPILSVGILCFVEYERTEASPAMNGCFCAELYRNCRRMNKRNVVDAIVFGFLRLCGEMTQRTSKDNGNASVTGRACLFSPTMQHCTTARARHSTWTESLFQLTGTVNVDNHDLYSSTGL